MDDALVVAKACNFMVGRMNPTMWNDLGDEPLWAEVRTAGDEGAVLIMNERALLAVRRASATAQDDMVRQAFVEGAASGLSFAARVMEVARLSGALGLASFSHADELVGSRRWRLAWVAFVDTTGSSEHLKDNLPYFPEQPLSQAIAEAIASSENGSSSAQASKP